MGDMFRGSRTIHGHVLPRKAAARSPRSMFGPGSRRRWGLEEVVLPPPSFPVTTAHALHDLLKCETEAVKESLARGYKRHHELPKPPQLLSKFSIRGIAPPPRKPQCFGGSRSTKAFGKESLLAKSPSRIFGGSMVSPGAQSRGNQAHGSLRSPTESRLFQPGFQLKGLKTQGTRATIIEQLEQYRLNSQARMQLKQRSELTMWSSFHLDLTALKFSVRILHSF